MEFKAGAAHFTFSGDGFGRTDTHTELMEGKWLWNDSTLDFDGGAPPSLYLIQKKTRIASLKYPQSFTKKTPQTDNTNRFINSNQKLYFNCLNEFQLKFKNKHLNSKLFILNDYWWRWRLLFMKPIPDDEWNYNNLFLDVIHFIIYIRTFSVLCPRFSCSILNYINDFIHQRYLKNEFLVPLESRCDTLPSHPFFTVSTPLNYNNCTN